MVVARLALHLRPLIRHRSPRSAPWGRVDYANGLDATGGLLYSVRTFNQDSSLNLRKGWDDTTGVGSPYEDWIAGS